MPRPGLTPPQTPLNDLDPVWIPNIAKPVPGDTGVDGGLGIWFSNHDVDVLVKLPDSTPLSTFFQLYWGSETVPVAHTFISPVNENVDYLTMTVPSQWIRPDYADPVFCKVTSPSQNATCTRPIRLRVKFNQPGGRDPNEEEPGHQGLNFRLPDDVLINGVDDERAKLGVDVLIHPYLHMSRFDTCRLVWGSEIIEKVVQADDVGEDLIIRVDYQNILRAGDSDLLTVAFQVRDSVGNLPDFYAQWSAPQQVRVSLNLDFHDAPWLGDAGDPENEVHLAILGEDDQKVSMFVGTRDYAIDDEILLVWDGYDADGVGVPYTEVWPVDRRGVSRAFFIPNEIVRAIAGGRVTIFYEHRATSGGLRHSRRLLATVIGEPVPWLAPALLEAPAGYLDPATPQATVVFTAPPGWQRHQWVGVVITATNTENPVHYRDDREVGGIPPDRQITFVVPGNEIKKFDGHSIEVYYEWADETLDPPIVRCSLRLPLLVGEFVGDMPAVVVAGEVGGWLNPSDVPTGTVVTVPFAETEAGDEVTLHWTGGVEGASDSFTKTVAVNGEILEFTIAPGLIGPNLGTSVTIYYTVARAGKTLRFSRTLTLYIGVLPLAIDPRLMSLNGRAFKIDFWPTTGADSAGNTGVRIPVGGVPPYDYASSDPRVASVVGGKVTGNANGVARITVIDQLGTSVGYDVSVTNVYRLVINETLMTSHESITWAQSIGGVTSYFPGFAGNVNLVYIPPQRTVFYWACVNSGRWGIFLHRGSPIKFAGSANPNGRFGAWCIVLT